MKECFLWADPGELVEKLMLPKLLRDFGKTSNLSPNNLLMNKESNFEKLLTVQLHITINSAIFTWTSFHRQIRTCMLLSNNY